MKKTTSIFRVLFVALLVAGGASCIFEGCSALFGTGKTIAVCVLALPILMLWILIQDKWLAGSKRRADERTEMRRIVRKGE